MSQPEASEILMCMGNTGLSVEIQAHKRLFLKFWPIKFFSIFLKMLYLVSYLYLLVNLFNFDNLKKVTNAHVNRGTKYFSRGKFPGCFSWDFFERKVNPQQLCFNETFSPREKGCMLPTQVARIDTIYFFFYFSLVLFTMNATKHILTHVF